jgi:hypothetical protein
MNNLNVEREPGHQSALRLVPLACGAALFFVAGCVQTNMTNPVRSATEQLLLSTATDRAMKSVSLVVFSGKKVFVDATYFDSYDAKNALGTVRDALNSAGALLVPTLTNAEYVVEARSGALSIDFTEFLLGMPNSGVPIPLAGTFNIPEIDLYKSQIQISRAKIALLAYVRTTGEHYFSSGPMTGKSYNINYKLLGLITWTRSDIPEKKRHKKHPSS